MVDTRRFCFSNTLTFQRSNRIIMIYYIINYCVYKLHTHTHTQAELMHLCTDTQSIVCPTGTKESSFSTTRYKKYPPNCSPDKGAIFFILPKLNLILGNIHLMGTNKYKIPESYFDSIRQTQIERISKMLQERLQAQVQEEKEGGGERLSHNNENNNNNLIIAGDFNFRCEISLSKNDPKLDKCFCGRDYQTVLETINMNTSSSSLSDMFHKNDRLCLFLDKLSEQQNEERNKNKPESSSFSTNNNYNYNFMYNTIDLFQQECFHHQKQNLIRPTFPFLIPPSSKKKKESQNDIHIHSHQSRTTTTTTRQYSTKRTPSWTDRILISKALHHSHYNNNSSYSNGNSNYTKKNDEEKDLILCCDNIHIPSKKNKKRQKLDILLVKKGKKNSEEKEKDDAFFRLGKGIIESIGSEERVLCSDHVPVYCKLRLDFISSSSSS